MLAKCLELTLHNGMDAMTGEQISIQTGDCASFTSYEQLERAFFDQMEYVTYQACSEANNFQHCRGVFEPHPLRICLLEDCIEKDAIIAMVVRFTITDRTKFNKSLFADEKGRETFTARARTCFARGGQQLTVTVVSPEDLQDAKLHPESHRDLIIRVGGYSDYFVNLAADLQESILERTFLEL